MIQVIFLCFIVFSLLQRNAEAYSKVYQRNLGKFAAALPTNHLIVNRDDVVLFAKVKEGNSPIRGEAVKNSVAKAMGYVMGIGAMFVYAPILIKILRRGNADGFALSTWIFNVFGLALATAYPAKKGFPLSTYVELIAATSQSAIILVLISIYQGKLVPALTFLFSTVIGFVVFLKSGPIPPKVLGWVQIAASLLANYANFPQIFLSFNTKQAAWSGATALMSMAGCFIRILTTLQLTKDPIVAGGYFLGFITNSILFAQVIMYGKK